MTLGGAVNLVPSHEGYDAPPFQVQMLKAAVMVSSRGQTSVGGVDGPWDYYSSVSGRAREGYREHSWQENTELWFTRTWDTKSTITLKIVFT